ncbi:MAG: hypothetical protein H8E57_08115 [Candidatus Cloacimonetes bacterium]|nr:hypothetical protein [Candidatus Cloacimonadota bacterium]
MKIILSRKGFDSSAGGYPSPILPDGTLLSLPIPAEKDSIKYSGLNINNDNFYDLMSQLNLKILTLGNTKIPLNKHTKCHFDPDIRYESLERSKEWKGLFGQSGSAQTHLENQHVKVGDLFLFFGWFRNTKLVDGEYKYDHKDKHGKHIIFGYLEIGHKILIKKKTDYEKWMSYHPHTDDGRIGKNKNVLYIAKERSSFSSNMKGYGTFNYDDHLVLTKEGKSRSRWDLPIFFKTKYISYHTINNWKTNNFQSTARGQEFVIEENQEVEKWAQDLIIRNYKD